MDYDEAFDDGYAEADTDWYKFLKQYYPTTYDKIIIREKVQKEKQIYRQDHKQEQYTYEFWLAMKRFNKRIVLLEG